MRQFTHFVARQTPADATLTIPYEQRQRSRFRTRLGSGEEVGVILERGSILRGGDRLGSSDGFVVCIQAAQEKVSTVHGSNMQELARVAYHLGNRHVALQIGSNWVRYLNDHVLDEMVEQSGLCVVVEQAAFEPEAGAYMGHQHRHE